MRRTLTLMVIGTVAVLATTASGPLARSTGRVRVTAKFSYVRTLGHYRDLRLKIYRSRTLLYDRPVTSRFCAHDCRPLLSGRHASPVHVVNLERGHEPDVVLSLFTGGAHCCVIEQVYSFAARTRRYVKHERDFGNAGAVIERLAPNRRPVFVSADNAFFYAFASFAASGAPIQIWSFRSRRFVNVTRRYPRQIARDAARWWTIFTHHLRAGEGFIAAWAADEDLLGHFSLVATTLQTELREGHLRSDISGVPTGRRFVTALQRFLRARGYA
jgi:hypothetical protein